MNNWKPYNLEQLAYYYNGMAFKPDDWKEEGIKIIRIEQLNNPTGHYDYYQGEVSENNGINNEDLIFSWSATLKVAIWKHGYGVLNQHLFKVVPKDIADKYFLYYLLDANMEKLGESSHGLTMKHIKRGELEKYIVSIPEIPEQQCIAKILSTADAVIEKTQAAIAKYKAIKQGMLQDLFTRGIDLNTNKLRPRYQDAPGLYKESKLGMIPREWEVERLENTEIEILDGDRGVNYPKENDLTESGHCLFLSATNVTKNGFKFTSMLFITKERDELLGTGKLVRKDIIVTTRGTIGNVVYYDKDVPYEHIRINSGMIILRNNDKEISNEYLYYFIKDVLFEIYFKDSVSGTAQPQLPIKDLKKLFVIYPKPDEQKLIAERIKAINNKLQTEQTYLLKMQSLKKGLMADLLSGKKQVKVSEPLIVTD